MINAFLFGLLATSSLIIGGFIATRFSLSKRAIGIIMGFGAGTLISAVSYELIFEAVHLAKMTGYPAYGFFAGAFTFYFADLFIGKMSAAKSNGAAVSKSAALIVPMVLAIILDGIPESIVIGLGMSGGEKVSLAMLVAVFVSNLPEAIAGSTGMKDSGWKSTKIIGLWLFIALFCSLASVAGYSLFTDTPDRWLAFIQAFAGGAILMMLANSMIPEAYEHGGRVAGIATVLGFFLAVTMVLLENSQ
jgi:zinc transporter, ZIP family